MTNPSQTRAFYTGKLGFRVVADYGHYLLVARELVELHFFLHENLVPSENDGQVYFRSTNIRALYHELIEKQVSIHPNGALEEKNWGQIEFSVLDPDYNLLTFGQNIAKGKGD